MEWKVVSFDFDGITVAGITQISDFDPDTYTDILPGITFASDEIAGMACDDYATAKSMPTFGELVPAAFGCPTCGSRLMDALIIADSAVTCAGCGANYEIGR
jgi:hypothetical protein